MVYRANRPAPAAIAAAAGRTPADAVILMLGGAAAYALNLLSAHRVNWRCQLLAGAVLSLLSGIRATTTIAGYKNYNLSAAFQGGLCFVLLQLMGWLALGATSVVSLWYCARDSQFSAAIGLGLGVPAFVANVLLLCSAKHFQIDSVPQLDKFVPISGYMVPVTLSVVATCLFWATDIDTTAVGGKHFSALAAV